MLEKHHTSIVCKYLKELNAIYRVDGIADIKLSIGQAKQFKKLYRHSRGYPDIFIAEPRGGYPGLYVEMKQGYSDVYTKRGGTLRQNEHIQEQHKMHEKLRSRGYRVVWGLGWEDAIEKIDEYLNL